MTMELLVKAICVICGGTLCIMLLQSTSFKIDSSDIEVKNDIRLRAVNQQGNKSISSDSSNKIERASLEHDFSNHMPFNNIRTTSLSGMFSSKISEFYIRDDESENEPGTHYSRIWTLDEQYSRDYELKMFKKAAAYFKNQKKKKDNSSTNNNNDDSSGNSKDTKIVKIERKPHITAYTGKIPQRDIQRDSHGCVPASKWHSYIPINCNKIHEIDTRHAMLQPKPRDDITDKKNRTASRMDLLFSGGSRDAWRYYSTDDDIDAIPPPINEATNDDDDGTRTTSSPPPVIIKTLRYIRDYSETRFHHQVLDALATERLTSSPYVVNSYGFCGTSTINEFADGGDLFHGFYKRDDRTSLEDLIVARDVALGLADIHGISDDDEQQEEGERKTTLVHHDIRFNNLLLVKGQAKFHDFNQGQILGWNEKKNKSCPFSWSDKCTKHFKIRAPEECLHSSNFPITEKVEVFRLGTVFFELLTHNKPYSFEPEKSLTRPETSLMVLDPRREPRLPSDVAESGDPATVALIKATRYAMTYSPRERPSARELAQSMVIATKKVMKKIGTTR